MLNRIKEQLRLIKQVCFSAKLHYKTRLWYLKQRLNAIKNIIL